MKISDIEKLKNIADGGQSRHLADALIGEFNELASDLCCESRLLRHGVLFQRGPGNAVFSVYYSRTSLPGSVEVALADENIERLYGKTATSIATWITYLTEHVGPRVKSSTSQGYPRISFKTVESGKNFIAALKFFFDKQLQFTTTASSYC